MRTRIFHAVLTSVLLASAPAVASAQDSLFSEVAMESVFETNVAKKENLATISDSETLTRITGATSLVRALKIAGFEPEQDDERVTLQLKHAEWVLPITMTVQLEQDRILSEMSLAKVEDSASINNEELLKLLSSSDAAQNAFFAYDREKSLILLRSSVGNRSLTARDLKKSLLKMASVAETQADVWSELAKKSTQKADKKAVVKTDSKPSVEAIPAKQAFSVVGTWSATTSKDESFAIRIKVDGSFQLVHLKSGKSTISKGKASRNGDRLTLAGDDKVTINGKITEVSADQFQLGILDSNNKEAGKLTFVKAKS